MNENYWWLILLLLMGGNPEAMEKLEEEKRMEDQRDICHHVKWEQDMNAHIPFCELTGEICNMQCMKGTMV